jgi:hypothetical protein
MHILKENSSLGGIGPDGRQFAGQRDTSGEGEANVVNFFYLKIFR